MSNFKILQSVLFFLIFTLLCVNGHLSAQDNKIKPTPVIQTQVDNSPISILLTPPPPGKLGISDMWKVTVINAGDQSYRLYFYGTLTENNAGLIAEASTIEVEIKKGTTIFKASDFPVEPEVNYVHKDPKYKNSLIQRGTVPPGDYTYCVYLIKKPEKIEYASQCLDVTIEDLNFLSLLTPGEEEAINEKAPVIFSWMSSKPEKNVTYKIKIVEVLTNQSPESAFERNKAWFEKEGLKTSTFNYPASAKPFELGKKYAWAVVSGQTESDIFTFTVGEQLANASLVYEPVPGEPCCFRVKIITTESINKLHFMGTNFLSVTPENNVSVTGQLLPTVFYLNSLPGGSSFISGSYIAKVCLNATSGNHTITTYKSSNGGDKWNYLSLSQVTCNSNPSCNCPTPSPLATSSIDGVTNVLGLGNLNSTPIIRQLPFNATYEIPVIACNPTTCDQTYSWKMYYYGNSLSNTPVVQTSTDRVWQYTFQNPNYGIYMLEFQAKCGDEICLNDIDTFRVEHQKCECGNILSPNLTLGITPPSGSMVTVPDNIATQQAFLLNLPHQFTIPEYACGPQPPCNSLYYIKITQLFGGWVITENYSRISQYSFQSYGSYKVEYLIYCGADVCKSVIDTLIIVKEIETCSCWEWDNSVKNIHVNISGLTSQRTDFNCGQTLNLSSNNNINSINVSNYNCYPDNQQCLPSYTWLITKMSGALIRPEGNGKIITYNTDLASIKLPLDYKVLFYPWCNGVRCSPCSLIVKKRYSRREEWIDLLIAKASELNISINQNNFTLYDDEKFILATPIKGIENYDSVDYKSGKDILFVYADMYDMNKEGWYIVKFTYIENGIGEVQIINLEDKSETKQQAEYSVIKNSKSFKGIKITIEQNPGGPCGIEIPIQGSNQLTIINIPYFMLNDK